MQYNEEQAFADLKKLMWRSRIPCTIADDYIAYPYAYNIIFKFSYIAQDKVICISSNHYDDVSNEVNEMCSLTNCTGQQLFNYIEAHYLNHDI